MGGLLDFILHLTNNDNSDITLNEQKLLGAIQYGRRLTFCPQKGGANMEYMAMTALLILLCTGYIIVINSTINKK